MNAWDKLNEWKRHEIISDIEVEFARFLREIEPEVEDNVLIAAAACIHAQKNGHICFDLGIDQPMLLFGDEKSGVELNKSRLNNWKRSLLRSSLVSKGESLKPLVFEDNRLYLHKYWSFENEFTQWVKKRAESENALTANYKEAIHHFIKAKDDLFEVNWQEIALCLSFLKNLVVISGGPGTGKTHTVLNIIAAHTLAAKFSDDDFTFALAAPTGKAARRLVDSIEKGKGGLPEHLKSQIKEPIQAQTVHKLLGASFRGNNFKFDQNNHLPYDLVIVDEASMLDIHMWVRLIRALGPDTKLVVMGDKDQLASVEAGSILGDLCHGSNDFSSSIAVGIQEVIGVSVSKTMDNSPKINDCLVFLTKSYRFEANSGIKKLADAINSQEPETVLNLLRDSKYTDLHWFDIGNKSLEKVLNRYGIAHYENYVAFKDKRRIYSSHKKKVLCAIRKTDLGVEKINKAIEIGIKRKNSLISNVEWYDGRLVMATKNDVALRIRNGEMGIYNSKEGKVSFESEHNLSISPSRLTDYECAYAITIHKSQGSEFEDVAIILPEKDSSVLSKEILYTAVTRARKNTLVVGSKDIIEKTIKRSVNRQSGVKAKIWSL